MHNRHGVRGHIGATKLVTIGGVAVKSSQRVTPWDQAGRVLVGRGVYYSWKQ